MTSPPRASEVERFRSLVANRLGLQFTDTKLGFLGEVLARRLSATRRRVEDYFGAISMDGVDDELTEIARELTVPETYFFRNIDQFHALVQQVVPDRVKARGSKQCLRVLSAGCASGEEAYTIEMVLRDALPPGWSREVLAVDINPVVLNRARRGHYSKWSLRETPENMQQRWFTREDREVVLDERVRTGVKFEQRNLVADNFDLWEDSFYDVIFCRNVTMYFTPESTRALITRMSRALKPGGYLFLGHAETLRGISEDFQVCQSNGTFYYQRTDRADESGHDQSSRAVTEYHAVSALESLVDSEGAWVEVIRMASERVASLVAGHQPFVGKGNVWEPLPDRPWKLDQAFELLGEERFVEALEVVDALPAGSHDDAEALLLRAVLLLHSGFFGRAEMACQRLLEREERLDGAHYVLALCREEAGDLAGAIAHDQLAAKINPDFAMPHLHLGLLARREGDLVRMQVAFSEALALLEHCEEATLLLYGGGFHRDTLIALCRAQLPAVEVIR